VRISWLDVFTDRPMAGNPLAVVHDADALSAEQMQALAGELGLSETIFVLEDARRLRIFTPEAELPLAGHPVVGAAFELARVGRIPSEGSWTFQTGVGETPVEVSGGHAVMTQAPPELGPELDAAELAALLNVPEDAVVGAPQICSTAFPIAFVELDDRERLRALQPDLAGLARYQGSDEVCAFARIGPGRLAQRCFLPRLGIDEDPATGAAAGGGAALRVFRGDEPGREEIEQGDEVARPARIFTETAGEPGRPERVRVGGTAVLVLEAEVAPGVY
jgi:trans-2,3-dihydro-3-hydroxyanthranilate isomerase